MYTHKTRFGPARPAGRSRVQDWRVAPAPPDTMIRGAQEFEQGPPLSRIVAWLPTYSGRDPLGGISGLVETDPVEAGFVNRPGVNITPSYDCTQVEAWQLSGARWG